MPKITSVDDYIASKPKAVRRILDRVRSLIREALPQAQEVLSYGMPTYKIGGARVIYFAAWSKHFSLYGATRELLAELEDELAPYKVEKGTIQIPLAEPVPADLISRIAHLRARRTR